MKRDLSIWFCEGCQSVHFRREDNLLTFSPEEFLDFASAIGDIYSRAYLEVFNQRNDPNYFEFNTVS